MYIQKQFLKLTWLSLCVFHYKSYKSHLEIVSELTTEAFIATLRRFIARRGYPRQIHSDNGTNFVGSLNYLKELHQFLASKILQEKFHNFCLPHEI